MKLTIYTLRGALYEGDAESVNAPAADGEITILERHVPLMTALTKGSLRFKSADIEKEFAIEDGFLYTDGTHIIILARND